MTYVLRKSFGAYSAGTPVESNYEDPNLGNFYINGVEVPTELVVKLRNRTSVVPLINSRARRKQNKLAKQIALGMAAKTGDNSGN